MKQSSPPKTKPVIRFSTALHGSLLKLSKSASAQFSSPGATMVEGVINNLPFRAEFEAGSKGIYSLKLSKAMQTAVGVGEGDVVTVEITRIGEEPETRVPTDLRKALVTLPAAQTGWESITPMARRDWIFSICTAKLPETRVKRIEKACDMLASGKRRLCCFPGIKWLMEKNKASCGMWLPLASSKSRLVE